MNVWTYWAGPKPKWIDVCLKSIARCCVKSKFHLLTPDNLPDLDLPQRWTNLSPGVGTDFLRSALLYHYGGLWIDADTVCIEDPIKLITNRHLPTQFLYSTWTNMPRRAIAGYVYSPKASPIVDQWYDACRSALINAETIGWGSLGEKTLTPIIECNPSAARSWEIPLQTFLPIDIDKDPSAYFDYRSWRPFVGINTIAFGLNYSWMNHKYGDAMNDFTQRTLVSQLLHDAEVLNAK